MENSENLALPYIMPSQAQAHVTHNEALRMLDAIVQLAVLDRDLAEPPASPAPGARYIVGAEAAGAWSGHDSEVAAWQDGGWAFHAPVAGWLAWVEDEGLLCLFSEGNWTMAPGGAGDVNPVSLVGVNETADATNRLAVSSPASLFGHEGDDHRLKINKAAAGDTASVLFQTGFVGHAEFGLAGDDDWHVKVSPDGSAWHEAIVVDRATGAVSLPNTAVTGGRELLAAPRTYHVDAASGDDGNDGLSTGTAFATIQAAIDMAASLDFGIHNITISVAAGTYSDPVVLKSLVGAGELILVGDETTPANVEISVADGAAIAPSAAIVGTYRVRGFRLATAGSGGPSAALKATGAGCAVYFRNVEFASAGGAHINSERLALIEAEGDYTIAAGADRHWWASNQGIVSVVGRTITLSGTPGFATAFAYANVAGLITCAINSFSGSATGKRYDVRENSTIRSSGATLPGSTGGSAADGGVYT